MIRAVCFDFFNTLAYYHPSREQVYIDVCAENGIKIEPRALARSLPSADAYWREENRRSPIDKRNKLGQMVFFIEYISRAVNGTGVKINKLIALKILMRMKKYKWEFKVYNDTIPTLKSLKEKGYIVGLISNVDKDFKETYKSLGINQYLDFNVSSMEAGCDKPAPGIFNLALKKAGVAPEEALYIGDQYHLDIVGARNSGINAVLIDRYNWFDDITDCPRISTLSEIVKVLQSS